MKISKPFAITYLAVWLILIYATPKSLFYSGESTFRWLVFGVLFFLLPYLLYQCIADTALSAKLKIGIPIVSVFLAMPFGLFLNLSAQQELKDYGVKTHGTITKAWLWVRRSRADVWSVQATYKVGDKIYRTSTKTNPEKSLFKGDTVMVIYSSKTPELSEIIELIAP